MQDSDQPLVSAVIPVYNHEKYVRRAVSSVLAQSYPNLECIVVDDGSTDGTPDLLATYGDAIRVIRKENAGLSAARNTGIEAARGDYVGLLDSDDAWVPEKIVKQLELFRTSDSLVLVSCRYNRLDEDGNIIKRSIGNDFASHEELCNALYFRNVVSGSASGALIRREVFDAAGRFDETLSAAEDWDMWLRIARIGGIQIHQDSLTSLRYAESSMSGYHNAGGMLSNELRVLEKLRSIEDNPRKLALIRQGEASRYLSAAGAFVDAGDFGQARQSLRSAFAKNPRLLIMKRFMRLTAKSVFRI